MYPNVSILGPLLFSINLCDLFLSAYSTEFSNFADDTTPYECGKNYCQVINKLEDTIWKLFNWLQCNNFKANASKCHFFLSPHKPVTIKIKESAIESSNSEKFLGVTIDSKFSFDNHITILCCKTSQKFQGSKFYEFWQKRNSFKNIYCLTIQLLSISVDVSKQKSE